MDKPQSNENEPATGLYILFEQPAADFVGGTVE